MQEEIYKNLSLEDLPGEEWRDVVGYDNKFMVSNMGRVKMLERKVLANKSIKTIKEHILKQHVSTKEYLYVHLWSDNKKEMQYVHKIVLSSFFRCKKATEECNHKNEIRTDNSLENLEWLSHKENINYGYRSEKHSASMKNHKSLSKPIVQLSLDGILIEEYPSLREAGRRLGVSYTHIGECCRGKINSAFGYKFQYK